MMLHPSIANMGSDRNYIYIGICVCTYIGIAATRVAVHIHAGAYEYMDLYMVIVATVVALIE